ncbi:MAG: hypothetical protein KatS3mg025_0099 [Bacteroidia bacterium]|nr:MAG: hypothetical protein KatS3mg025_0099 [Bacteroidia bacterium]
MSLLLWIGALVWAQAPLWEVSLPKDARIKLLPDGHLLVVSLREGVYALDAGTGQKRWECAGCRGLSQEWYPIDDSPLYENGSLQYAPPGAMANNPAEIALTQNLAPYKVLNTATGKLVFDRSEARKSWDWVSGRALCPEAGLLILFGVGPKDPKKAFSLQTSILAAYDVRTGEERWRRPAGENVGSEQLQSNISCYEGTLYFLTNRALYAVDARTGQNRWRTEIVKGISFQPTTGTFVFADPERDWIVAYGRGRLIGVRRSTGEKLWEKPIPLYRNRILHAFSTEKGVLLFTDDVAADSDALPTGNNLLYPPLALLVQENGQNPWGERLKTPGLLAGYIPLDEKRLFCVFMRERFWQSRHAPRDNWKVEIDVLDIERGQFLFQKPISLKGTLLHAQNVPGGFLVQTTRRLQYISETGEVLWEKPLKSPFSIPFAVREEGPLFEAYGIDDNGQLFVWRGAGTQPEPLGKPISAFQSDPPQGIAYDKGHILVWGGSSLYRFLPNGKEICHLQQPVPAQPPLIRLLGATVSLAAYVGSAYLGYKALQEVVYDPDRPWDRLNQAPSLRQMLKAASYATASVGLAVLGDATWTALVQRRYTQLKAAENLAFLAGMQGTQLALFVVDKDSCTPLMEKTLGKVELSRPPQFEIDPVEKRLFVIQGTTLQAYTWAKE